MNDIISQIKKATEGVRENDRALFSLPGGVDIQVSRLDREAVILIEIMEKAGLDIGSQTIIAMRLLFWVQFINGGIGVGPEESEGLLPCPACGFPELEPDEEANVDNWGPSWYEQPVKKTIWFCPNCQLAGTLAEIQADKNLVLPWKED